MTDRGSGMGASISKVHACGKGPKFYQVYYIFMKVEEACINS